MVSGIPQPSSAPSPLAEGRWLWRRLYVFAVSAAAWALLDRLIGVVPPAAAAKLAERLMGLLALTMVLYLVAPTAQQLLASLRLLKTGWLEGADRGSPGKSCRPVRQILPGAGSKLPRDRRD